MPSASRAFCNSVAISGSSRGTICRLRWTISDPAAEAGEHLPEFESDVATAQDRQALRYLGQFHDGFVGQVADCVEARDGRNARPRAGINKDALTFESLLCAGTVGDYDLMRLRELRVRPVQVHVWPGIDAALIAVAALLHHLVLLRHHRREVHADVAGAHAPARRVARVMHDLGAMHHGFCRRATRIDAGTAEVSLLHHGDCPSVVRQGARERVSGLPAPDDDRVVFHVSSQNRLNLSSWPLL